MFEAFIELAEEIVTPPAVLSWIGCTVYQVLFLAVAFYNFKVIAVHQAVVQSSMVYNCSVNKKTNCMGKSSFRQIGFVGRQVPFLKNKTKQKKTPSYNSCLCIRWKSFHSTVKLCMIYSSF